MRWSIGTLAAGALGLVLTAFAAGRLSARWGGTAAEPPPASACPELDMLDPALASGSVPDLERRYREGYLLPPSAAEKQLAALRASADVYLPERRACMAKVALVHAIAGQEQMLRTTPALWGLGHPSDELRRSYLTLPLIEPYSEDERLDIVAQLEENFITSLTSSSEGDTEHWRRRYYGLVLTCSATDEALARLGAARPSDCLHLRPRAAKHDAPPRPSAGGSGSPFLRLKTD